MMHDINESLTITPPSLIPASLPKVHLSLTIVYTTLYSFLFLLIYVELWMILAYRHKRFSFQTVFLFLCLLWAGLRITLFSFYFKNTSKANDLCSFLYWLLYCSPVCLQFFTLCLLVLFVSKILYRASTLLVYYWRSLQIITLLSVILFTVTNITCAIITKKYVQSGLTPPYSITLTRVIINDVLFIIYALLLSVSIYKVSKLPSTHHVLESLGTTKFQATVACCFMIPLYVSRALYNLIAISNEKILNFGYSWINVSDQVDNGGDVGSGYISFGIILFVWEFLPTLVVVVFFRVKVPEHNMQMLPSATGGCYNSQPFYFDDPTCSNDAENTPDNTNEYSVNRMLNAANPITRHLEPVARATTPNRHTSSRLHPSEQSIQDYYDGT